MKLSPKLRAWVVDAGERVGSTFLAAFLGSFGLEGITALAGGHIDMSALRVAEQAGAAAVLALVKAGFAARVNNTVSPASLAPQQQPGQAESDAPGPGPLDARESTSSDAAAVVRTIVLPEKPVRGKPLGRHVHHDERSRAYAVTPQTAPLVSVRHKRHAGVFNQGDLGSCTGNACAGALSTAPFGHRFTEARAIKIYKDATVIDDVPGQYPPDDTGSDGLSVAKVAQRDGWCSSYQHCFSLDAVLTALQAGPVLLGVTWLTGFDTPASDGRLVCQGSARGGHEIVADEIDVERKRVWITNSWGSSWGIQGRAYWTFDDLASVLADNGDATVLVK